MEVESAAMPGDASHSSNWQTMDALPKDGSCEVYLSGTEVSVCTAMAVWAATSICHFQQSGKGAMSPSYGPD